MDGKEKTDAELIKIIVTAPDNAAAKAAKEQLEYRKYLAQKRQNTGILLLTIILMLSAIVQATVAMRGPAATAMPSTAVPHCGVIGCGCKIVTPGMR